MDWKPLNHGCFISVHRLFSMTFWPLSQNPGLIFWYSFQTNSTQLRTDEKASRRKKGFQKKSLHNFSPHMLCSQLITWKGDHWEARVNNSNPWLSDLPRFLFKPSSDTTGMILVLQPDKESEDAMLLRVKITQYMYVQLETAITKVILWPRVLKVILASATRMGNRKTGLQIQSWMHLVDQTCVKTEAVLHSKHFKLSINYPKPETGCWSNDWKILCSWFLGQGTKQCLQGKEKSVLLAGIKWDEELKQE